MIILHRLEPCVDPHKPYKITNNPLNNVSTKRPVTLLSKNENLMSRKDL